MPRIRYIKPEFFSDEDLSELKFETRLTFAGLWCYADKSGRLENRPKFLKAMIFPYENVDIEKQLDALSKTKSNGKPFIQRYEIDGLKLIEIPNWDKHQKPHHTEKDSIFPPAPPFKERDNGDGECLNDSTELSNVPITVKEPLKKIRSQNNEYSSTFIRFWKSYPRKEAKVKAWEEWKKINPSQTLVLEMIEKIEKFKLSRQWTKDRGEFIPLPATWLHQRRWEDEVSIKDLKQESKGIDPTLQKIFKEAEDQGWKT